MPTPIFKRLMRPQSGAFLTLLALGLLAPGSVRAAGCSHDKHAISHFDLLVQTGAIADSDELTEAARPMGPTKCDGPMCSRKPAAPSPSPSLATGGHDSWACLLEKLDERRTPPSRFAPVAAPVLSIGRHTSIFHPPRGA
jgi:hypothetical protein